MLRRGAGELKGLIAVAALTFIVFVALGHAYLSHAAVVGTARICGPDATPTPASSNGYTCEVFWDNFGSSSTIDSSNTKTSGFKWYLNNGWPGLAWGDANVQNFSATPSGDVTIVASGMQVDPSTNPTLNQQGLYNVASCVTTGNSGQSYGYAIQAERGYYLDVNFASESSAGKQSGNTWWPVFWLLPTEFFDQKDPSPSKLYFGELDIVEDLGIPSGRYMHKWGQVNNTTIEEAGSPVSVGSYRGGLPHTYGMLVIPEHLNAGTGSINGYIDDVVDPNSPGALTWTAGSMWELLETQHYCILLTSGFNQASVLGYIRVWQ